MAKILSAVFDTGPLIHLREIHSLSILGLFDTILISVEVKEELKDGFAPINSFQKLSVKNLGALHKDQTRFLTDKYSIDLGEASSICLALQEKIPLFMTDDMDARAAAKALGLEVHGTIGILLRAFREQLLTKEEAKKKIIALHAKSSLFISRDLISYALRELERWKRI